MGNPFFENQNRRNIQNPNPTQYVSGITDGTTVPTPVIDQINGNLEINRIA